MERGTSEGFNVYTTSNYIHTVWGRGYVLRDADEVVLAEVA